MTFQLRVRGQVALVAAWALWSALAGCGSGVTIPPAPAPTVLSVVIETPTAVLPQDGTAIHVPVIIAGPTGTPTVTMSGLPASVAWQFSADANGSSGTISLAGSTATAPGVYSTTVTVKLAGQTATASLSVVSAVVAKVLNTTDTVLGVNGHLQEFMSTSFQVAEWTKGFFGTGATTIARENTLNSLQPQHIRLQGLSEGVAMRSNTGTAADWDFTLLDQTVQPVLASADHSPELQIAVAPAWMLDPSTGYLDITNHLDDFAAYAANLVKYYNKGGFDVGKTHFQSASSHSITWWGIFNEPNANGLTASQYLQLYNKVVPAMQAVDPTIKFSALEFSDYGLGSGGQGDPEQYLPTFWNGLNAQVNVLSMHLYGTCNQTSQDAELFNAVPGFVDSLQYFLLVRSNQTNVPVWVTENNVNADYADSNGMSVCNPGQKWVLDQRATDAFFAAWRPYVFSQLGKAGNEALMHWEYTGGAQYDEVDGNGNPLLSYWVDKALENYFPTTAASPGAAILTLSATDTSSVETLATRSANGVVTVMVVDRAVHSSNDDDGTGDPRTVVVDTSSLGTFYSASVLTIDAATSAINGPSGVGVTPASRITISLPGYGVAFLTLTP